MDIARRRVACTVAYGATRDQIFQVIPLVIEMLVGFVMTLKGPLVGFLLGVIFTYIPVTHATSVIVTLEYNLLYLFEFFGCYVSGVSSVFRVVLVRFVRHAFKVIFTLFILINYTFVL